MKTNQIMKRIKWAPIRIDGVKDDYVVSTEGEVMNVKTFEPIIGVVTNKGYRRVSLVGVDKKKYVFIHRLVANAFLPNPKGLPEVNHKNGIKEDNRVENLEWCTSAYNSWHKFNVLKFKVSDETKRKLSNSKKGSKMSQKTRQKMSDSHIGKKRSKESVNKTAAAHKIKILQKNFLGECINKFDSLTEASDITGISLSCISSAVNGKAKTAGGYIWTKQI